MFKIKKGDTVQVIRGDDKGKKGKVLKVLIQSNKAVVEGINLVKKHRRQTRQDQSGGIVSIEMPMSISNIALLCKGCSRPAKVGFTVLKDGVKSRICKACKEAI